MLIYPRLSSLSEASVLRPRLRFSLGSMARSQCAWLGYIAAPLLASVCLLVLTIWAPATVLAEPQRSMSLMNGFYEISPISTQRPDYPQMTTLRAGKLTYLKSLHLQPREFHLQGREVQVRGRIRPPNAIERQFWNGMVVDVVEVLSPKDVVGISLAGVREPPSVHDVAGLYRCVRAWCSVSGVLEWVRGHGPDPPYALLRLRDDSEVEILKVITAHGRSGLGMS